MSISIELNEADLVRGCPTMIDLTESERRGEHLAVIMRWLTERLRVHSDALLTSRANRLDQMAAEACLDLYR